MRSLKLTLYVIGAFQLVLGLAFLTAPAQVAAQLGLTPAAPAWANWLLAMMAARFLGYAYGMFWSARHPRQAEPWIDTMIVIQAIDWLATLAVLQSGDVTLRQVTTASFMPVLFIATLTWFHPRRLSATDLDDGEGHDLVAGTSGERSR
jgi:hypothetical protein